MEIYPVRIDRRAEDKLSYSYNFTAAGRLIVYWLILAVKRNWGNILFYKEIYEPRINNKLKRRELLSGF